MDKCIGKKLDGRYQLVELVGVGGMSNVYRAEDLNDGKTVAVKILRDEFANNEEFLRRFKNESKAIAMLSHPNIVKVYDVSFFERTKYIVMEYIDGISLKDYIDQQGVIKWKEAIFFTLQLLNALNHAHSRGIVHRDIKPQNVMLLSDGTIKITDFGIARFARNDSKTLTDKAIGSVHYISPEQASGMDTDERSDIYSLGVMLFEMLTGELPFEADSPVSVALKQIQSKPPRPTEINDAIPQGLESIIMRALEKSPDKRYQNASEMMRDIAEFKKNPSIKFAYKYDVDNQFSEGKVDKMKSNNKNLRNEDRNIKSKVPFIAVLSGITAAFVIVTLIFVGVLFIIKKPFANLPDITMPDLIGKDYKEVMGTKEYKSFDIEVLESKYSADYGEGEILYQNPPAGRT
ncbi:MAG: protein kinase, partial [Oscillospiraceae bacterium]